MKIPFIPCIGLMGVGNDNTLYTPSGKRICKVPAWASWRIQKVQNAVARWTWRHQPWWNGSVDAQG